MVDNENKKIENAIEFYMLANKLKYSTYDSKQSLADQIYGSMILATAINSEYNKVEKLGIVLRMILLGTMSWYYHDEMKSCLRNLNEGVYFALEIAEYFDSILFKSENGSFAFDCTTIECELKCFFEEYLID